MTRATDCTCYHAPEQHTDRGCGMIGCDCRSNGYPHEARVKPASISSTFSAWVAVTPEGRFLARSEWAPPFVSAMLLSEATQWPSRSHCLKAIANSGRTAQPRRITVKLDLDAEDAR